MTFFFIFCELMLFLYDAYLVSPGINSQHSTVTLNQRGKRLLNETAIDILILMIIRVLLYAAQLYIMCFRLKRSRAMDND